MVNKERNKWGLRQSPRERVNPYLASKVKVLRLHKSGICVFTFRPPFIDFVGMQMPMGVSEDRPAYLKVIEAALDLWIIVACYIGDDRGVVLWTTNEKPDWIPNKLQEEKHNDRDPSKGCNT